MVSIWVVTHSNVGQILNLNSQGSQQTLFLQLQLGFDNGGAEAGPQRGGTPVEVSAFHGIRAHLNAKFICECFHLE